MGASAALAAAALVVSAAGTAISASQQAASQRFQSKVLEQQAARAQQLAAIEADEFRRKQDRLRARQRARFAGAGVAIGEGTPLLVDEDMAADAEFGGLQIAAQGANRAADLSSDARLRRLQATRTTTSGLFSAGSSLLSAGSRVV